MAPPLSGRDLGGHARRERVILLKPTTYMERFRRAVQEAANFFKISAGEVTAFQDELELPPAKVRVKVGGGIAGSQRPAIDLLAYRQRLSPRCGSGSVTPASRNWCITTSCPTSPRR